MLSTTYFTTDQDHTKCLDTPHDYVKTSSWSKN